MKDDDDAETPVRRKRSGLAAVPVWAWILAVGALGFYGLAGVGAVWLLASGPSKMGAGSFSSRKTHSRDEIRNMAGAPGLVGRRGGGPIGRHRARIGMKGREQPGDNQL